MRTVLIFLAALAAASVAALAAGTPVVRAAFLPCPTQKQLEAHGAKASQVSSPAQVSTGKFPLTSTVIVPDEQCSYQGTLGLLLVYFHLTPQQAAAVQAHLAYECARKNKKCTAFVSKGTNVISTTNAATGQVTTKQVSTLNVIVTSGPVEGEASARFAPVSDRQCSVIAAAFWVYLGSANPVKGPNLGDQLTCRSRTHH